MLHEAIAGMMALAAKGPITVPIVTKSVFTAKSAAATKALFAGKGAIVTKAVPLGIGMAWLAKGGMAHSAPLAIKSGLVVNGSLLGAKSHLIGTGGMAGSAAKGTLWGARTALTANGCITTTNSVAGLSLSKSSSGAIATSNGP